MYYWYKSYFWINIWSASDFPKLAILTRRKGDFEGSGYLQHLPQNLGYTED